MHKSHNKKVYLLSACILCATALLGSTAHADFKADIASQALDTLVKSTSTTKSDGKPVAGGKTEIATTAIDTLIKTCEYDALAQVLNADGYNGILYRGLKIKGFLSADGGDGSIWGVTFQETTQKTMKAIPEITKAKSFKDKNGNKPIVLSISPDFENAQYAQLSCRQAPPEGYSD